MERQYVSPEYQEQLDTLAETLRLDRLMKLGETALPDTAPEVVQPLSA